MAAFILTIIFGGRVAVSHQVVQSAAADAARAASLARSADTAKSAGNKVATASLNNQSLNCAKTNVAIDTSGFAKPVGTAANVSVTVICSVEIADLGLVGLPGSMQVSATMVSPLDTYRERG
jgi:Flp pilus assembly protein TadG